MLNNQTIHTPISGADGHIIEGSGLVDGAGEYLVRTAVTGDSQKFSIDIIFKRSLLNEFTAATLFAAGTGNAAEFRILIAESGGAVSDTLEVTQVGGK